MRKIAHVKSLGYGLRTWDSPRYFIPGVSLSHSVYDVSEDTVDDEMEFAVAAGSVHTDHLAPTTNPTMTRGPRIGAQFSSAAQAHSWQGGWVTNWDHLIGLRPNLAQTRTLAKNYNPNQPGSKEQQRATVYNPWPSAGALYPKAI